ncbi:hypothetical protein SLS62_003033 [Diatrype stigma]|uniref:Uncharacterized protein n=1 Tax=Diatrype stigma TaxID=117547 RepID=A0AAN9V5J1_9PEZI
MNSSTENPSVLRSVWLFVWSCFLKPHKGDAKRNQQDALESFYKGQADAYDATRKTLLKGREDMLALAAAQVLYRVQRGDQPSHSKRRIWIDIGGGTGWNIEAMSQYIDVPQFFDRVYLVDFSPSLCEVARKRFARLGWKNVKVICQDARMFRLEDHEPASQARRSLDFGYFASDNRPEYGGADLITMSYSLSMMPDHYSIIDAVPSLLAPSGILAVVDFYVQSQVDVVFRNYTGGLVNRHVNFLARTFWRAWFDVDRVSLDPGRRDYLEYRFGTVLNVNSRNYVLGAIPYYIWLGAHKRPSSSSLPHEIVERVDALVTESPYLRPENRSKALSHAVDRTAPEIRSKAFDAAIANLSSNLPLPAFFYQNHHYRIHYDDQLRKHTQFNDEYIYAFTWEDTRVDERILKLKSDDVNHLLELKVAAYASLPYADFWQIFGEGKHPAFRSLLVEKMSPHLSSRAFQYWLHREHVFTRNSTTTTTSGGGLYDTGGSKHALRIFRWISCVFGCRTAVRQLLAAKTLNEQREVWRGRIRPALLSRLVSKFVVSQEAFLWTALGVPKNQLAIIEADHAASDAVRGNSGGINGNASGLPRAKNTRSHAIWEYMVSTLDPVVESTHIGADNPYYLVCLDGKFSPRCHSDYLSKEAHARLSRPGNNALEGLRIHTDELDEVIARVAPGTLTVAVVMDSMDWFDPPGPGLSPGSTSAATSQITKLNRALRMGGRVLLRSAGLRPWYVDEFERHGFVAKCHGSRKDGACIDRVNMYASCWVMTKRENLAPPTPEPEAGDGGNGPELSFLEI